MKEEVEPRWVVFVETADSRAPGTAHAVNDAVDATEDTEPRVGRACEQSGLALTVMVDGDDRPRLWNTYAVSHSERCEECLSKVPVTRAQPMNQADIKRLVADTWVDALETHPDYNDVQLANYIFTTFSGVSLRDTDRGETVRQIADEIRLQRGS